MSPFAPLKNKLMAPRITSKEIVSLARAQAAACKTESPLNATKPVLPASTQKSYIFPIGKNVEKKKAGLNNPILRCQVTEDAPGKPHDERFLSYNSTSWMKGNTNPTPSVRDIEEDMHTSENKLNSALSKDEGFIKDDENYDFENAKDTNESGSGWKDAQGLEQPFNPTTWDLSENISNGIGNEGSLFENSPLTRRLNGFLYKYQHPIASNKKPQDPASIPSRRLNGFQYKYQDSKGNETKVVANDLGHNNKGTAYTNTPARRLNGFRYKHQFSTRPEVRHFSSTNYPIQAPEDEYKGPLCDPKPRILPANARDYQDVISSDHLSMKTIHKKNLAKYLEKTAQGDLGDGNVILGKVWSVRHQGLIDDKDFHGTEEGREEVKVKMNTLPSRTFLPPKVSFETFQETPHRYSSIPVSENAFDVENAYEVYAEKWHRSVKYEVQDREREREEVYDESGLREGVSTC